MDSSLSTADILLHKGAPEKTNSPTIEKWQGVTFIVTSVRPFNNNNYQNKTLFNSCERLLLGTLILDIDIGISGVRSEQISMTLSTT